MNAQEPIAKENNPTKSSEMTPVWIGILISLALTGLIWWLGPRLNAVQLIPDQGASWYYWKLPNPSFWTHATAWGFYLLHQFSIWGLIYYAQTHLTKYSSKLRTINYLALGANALFIVLHIFQTHIWYDGLAQDVSIWSSQVSVIILLVWVLLMENNRRGMFFGKPLPISKEIIRFARKYHGYFFAWATIYTFWYHPAVASIAHLGGFLYMFLLLLQGSLFFTQAHGKHWWTFVLETAVVVHGTLVAVMQGNNLWPMFAFGFGGILIITQMHGLKLAKWTRWTLLGIYAASAIFIYSGRGWANLNEIVRIPVIEYLAVVVLAGIFWLGMWAAGKIRAQ